MRAVHSMLGIWLLGTCACTGATVSIGSDQQAGLDAGTDAQVDHATADTSILIDGSTEASFPGAFGACGSPITTECEAPTLSEWGPRVLFDAALLGSGCRIVDADGRNIWIDKEVGGVHETLLVTKPDVAYDAPYSVTVPLDSALPLRPVAAAGPTVLACSATDCSLYSWDLLHPEAKVRRLQGEALPSAAKPFAIGVATDWVYAVGEGVYRFQAGVWNTEIAPEAGVQWRAIATDMSDHSAVVVGDGGAVRVKMGDGPWEVANAGLQASLTAVSMTEGPNGKSILIGAEDGTLTRIESGEVHTCSIGVGVTSIWHYRPFYFSVQVAGSTTDGRGFQFGSFAPGCFSPVPPSGVLKTRVSICGISPNRLYLTDTVLYGTDFCAVD